MPTYIREVVLTAEIEANSAKEADYAARSTGGQCRGQEQCCFGSKTYVAKIVNSRLNK